MAEQKSKKRDMFEWEQHLAPQVRQVELLGELSLSVEETADLAREIGKFISLRRGWGVLKVREEIGQKFPSAFVAFLVAQGLHDSNAENGFWPDVDEALGASLDVNWHRQLGRLFEEILETNGLRLFPDMGGYRYVSLILVHGGIPNYALPDYFRYMLRPAVTRSIYAALSATDLIDEWLHHASGRYFIDKPVLRFLEYGGQVAVDFVERTRELAYEFLETNMLPSAEEVGLPQRVLREFHRWAVEGEGFTRQEISRRDTGLRLRRPEIQLDPWGEGLTLQLLPQQIPAALSQTRIEWEIKLEGQLEDTLPVRLERVGHNLQTTPASLVLERHVTGCQVTLLFDGEAQRSWSYDLSRPLLVFDQSRETLLSWTASLPARPLYLLYPQDVTLEVTGPARKIEAFRPLIWGWAGFKSEAWDLSQATRLALRRETEILLDVPIRTDEMAQRPHLIGGTLHQTFNLIATPLYLGAPPVLRIPLAGRTNLEEELARWRLTLYNPWPAVPSLNLRRVPLADMRSHLIEYDGYVELPLDIPALLGEAPMGNYMIRLRGPLGRDAELPLRLLPHLSLTGHEQLHLPDPQSGPAEVELLVEMPAGISLQAEAGDDPCQVNVLEKRPEQWTCQALVPPDLIEARLVAVKSQPEGEVVRVPLHVPLRRLRWTLTGDTEQTDSQRLKWAGWVVEQSVDALEQTPAPVLFVDLGHTEATQPSLREMLTLYLVDPDKGELQKQPFTKFQRDPGRSVWRFDLSPFLDTIRQNASPVVRFELEYLTPEGPARRPVISLTRAIHVDQVEMEVEDTALITKVRLTWREPVRLRHRRVRFWPVWQPWRPYREEVIPDDAAGELTFAVAGPDFLVGKYLVEFLVVDPWTVTTRLPDRPRADGPNTAILELTPAAERLEQIERGIRRNGPGFSLFLEHAFIEADQGRTDQALADLWQGYDWLDQASLPQLLAMAGLVERLEDKKLLAHLRMQINMPERLQRFLAERQAGHLTLAQFEAYRVHLLRSNLWTEESCSVLLHFPDEQVQLYTIMQLLKRAKAAGCEAILDRLKQNRLSEIDAIDLFELKLNLVETYLTERLADPLIARLYQRLTERYPEREWTVFLVHPGCFVHTCAGWGRINGIEMLADGCQVVCFRKEEAGFRLSLSLRPMHDNIPVTAEILADRQRVLFEPGQQLYQCTKTRDCAFVTPDQDLLYNGHNRAAHDGIGARYGLRTSPLLSILPPVYRLRAPRDMLL